MDRLSIIAKSNNNVVRLVAKDNALTMTAHSDFGNAEELLEFKTDGVQVALHCNYKYLADCLKAIDDETVNLCFGKDESSPFFVQPTDNGDYKYLILPVRVNNA